MVPIERVAMNQFNTQNEGQIVFSLKEFKVMSNYTLWPLFFLECSCSNTVFSLGFRRFSHLQLVFVCQCLPILTSVTGKMFRVNAMDKAVERKQYLT